MHITINKADKDGYYWFLLDNKGNEIHRTGFFPNEKTCSLNALSFQALIELGGGSVTVRKSYDPPDQLITVAAQLRDEIERITGKRI